MESPVVLKVCMLTRYFPYSKGQILGHGPPQVINNLLQELSQLGVRTDVIAEGTGPALKNNDFTVQYVHAPYEFHSLLKRIRTYSGRLHLVHSHTIVCLSHTFYKLLYKNSPFLLQLHHSLKSERISLKLSTLFHFADRILVLNRFEADIIRKFYNVSRRKIITIYNGVDTKLFKPLPEEGKNLRKMLGLGKKKIILSVGRPSPAKGHEWLLKALSNVKNEISDVHLLLVGLNPESQNDVQYIQQLQKSSKNLGISDRVTIITDFVPHDELAVFYSAADVYALASFEEVFNLTILEAMACGLPVIATTVGAASDVLTKNFGTLVPPRDTDELSDAILKILCNDKIQEMGSNARNVVLQRFTWKKVASLLLRIYEEATL